MARKQGSKDSFKRTRKTKEGKTVEFLCLEYKKKLNDKSEPGHNRTK
jgi:hypothetical protein